MSNYFIKYKPFLSFLGKFLLTYLILTIVYRFYLSRFDSAAFEVDDFTKSVAEQTKRLMLIFNADARTEPHPLEACIKLFYNGRFVARIIEGCNALSVIVLFISFVIAFTGRLKHTFLFIIFGSILIHILNVARIAILAVLLHRFPEYEHFLHGTVFPLFIYSVVFVLWVVWVNKYSLYAGKAVQK